MVESRDYRVNNYKKRSKIIVHRAESINPDSREVSAESEDFNSHTSRVKS